MTVRLLYFAWVREKLGQAEETVSLPAELTTVADVLGWQAQRSEIHRNVFTSAGIVRVAVDQTHAQPSVNIKHAREIAFFPPVTGG